MKGQLAVALAFGLVVMLAVALMAVIAAGAKLAAILPTP